MHVILIYRWNFVSAIVTVSQTHPLGRSTVVPAAYIGLCFASHIVARQRGQDPLYFIFHQNKVLGKYPVYYVVPDLSVVYLPPLCGGSSTDACPCSYFVPTFLFGVIRESRDLARKTVEAVRVLADMGRINQKEKGLLLADVIR